RPADAIQLEEEEDEEKTCPMYGWVGPGNKDSNKRDERLRYMWIDINAGTVTMGPMKWGEGLILKHTLTHQPAQLFDAQTNKDKLLEKHRKQMFLAGLTSFVKSTSQLLISPSFHSFPNPYSKYIKINMVFIHEHKQRQKYAQQQTDRGKKAEQEKIT